MQVDILVFTNLLNIQTRNTNPNFKNYKIFLGPHSFILNDEKNWYVLKALTCDAFKVLAATIH